MGGKDFFKTENLGNIILIENSALLFRVNHVLRPDYWISLTD